MVKVDDHDRGCARRNDLADFDELLGDRAGDRGRQGRVVQSLFEGRDLCGHRPDSRPGRFDFFRP